VRLLRFLLEQKSALSDKVNRMSSHCGHNHQTETGSRALQFALWITLAFMVIELLGGWLADSLALMTDAVHMMTDVGSLLLALFVAWITKRPARGRLTYGYYRAEILGALASGLALWAICGLILYEAVRRALHPPDVHGPIVVVIACIALIMNLVTMRVLHGHHHGSMNVRAAYLHVLSDLLGNLGTLVAGIIIWTTGWMLADPIVSAAIAIIIIISAWRMIREAIEILMEASPRWIDPTDIKTTLLSINGVDEVHDLHLWTVSTGRIALSVHLVSRQPGEVLRLAHQELADRHQILFSTIQVEHPDQFDPSFCYDTT
jgi:cobalt-zinc-cadmium efflux system protein